MMLDSITQTMDWIFLKDKLRIPACLFWSYFHFYCPGCGGTRAFKALLQGELLKSVWYHPVVGYSVFVVFGDLLCCLRNRFFASKEPIKIPGQIQLYLALGMILGNFLLKNFLLFFAGIEM